MPLLEVKNLSVHFDVRGVTLKAVDDVSFRLMPGESLGIVGESGCGKSTVARSIIRLNAIAGGHVDYQGHDLASLFGVFDVFLFCKPDMQRGRSI